jgi:hypothetical protein
MEAPMADNSEDNAGLGLIVGILAAAIVIVLALGFAPTFNASGDRDFSVTVETPAKAPAPTPQG